MCYQHYNELFYKIIKTQPSLTKYYKNSELKIFVILLIMEIEKAVISRSQAQIYFAFWSELPLGQIFASAFGES